MTLAELLEDGWTIFQRYFHPGMRRDVIVLKKDGSTKSITVPPRYGW